MTTAQIKHVGFTLPSPMEREFHQIAREEHRTKSELFREMFRVYRSYRKRHPEPEIDDAWVMQVIREAQEEERRNPMTIEELLRESRALSEYGARQAKKVGIDVEDEEVINRIVHEERARWREKNRA
jgi:metal-responsive CopG/Arc/MetJ family transcriptional regulator